MLQHSFEKSELATDGWELEDNFIIKIVRYLLEARDRIASKVLALQTPDPESIPGVLHGPLSSARSDP